MLMQLLSLSTEAYSTSTTFSIKELSACQTPGKLTYFHSVIKQSQAGLIRGIP